MSDNHEQPSITELILAGAMNAAFYNSPDAIYVMDLDGAFIECNDALVQRLGIPRAELLTMNFAPTVAEGNSNTVRENFLIAAGGLPVEYEAEGTRGDGSTFSANAINMPLLVEGKVAAVLGIARDIDELDSTRRDRDQLANLLEMTINTITDAIFLVDSEWKFTFVNPRGTELTGLSKDQIVGHDMWKVFPTAHGSEFGIGYKRAVAEQRIVETREWNNALGLTLAATALPTAEGLAIFVRDVSSEEDARVRLVEQDTQIRAQAALLDTARDAIMVRGLDNTIKYWNRAAAELYGWTAEEVMGTSVRELLYNSPEQFDLATATVLEHGTWLGDIEQVNRDGHVIIVDCRWSLVRDDDDGEPTAILSVNTDVTERRKDEALSLRAQRMESLGTLAGGIAHDLNNVLTPLLMSVQMLVAKETDESKLRSLSVIETSARRGADMLRQVLSFARGVEGRRVRVDTDRIIHDVAFFCTETLPKSITVHSDSETGLWKTMGDPTQLQQVMVNLISNARDAMPHGGHLHLSARNQEVTSPERLRLPSAGNYVLFEVEDTGSGIAVDHVDKIFDPFFTTKGVGEGTGLGLATSVAIVRSHGGNIQVYSEEGVGTRFAIYLPASASDATETLAKSVSRSPEAPHGTGQLILIVDDEPIIRQSAREALERSGYTAVVTANGREALDCLASMPEKPALVFSDLTMPVMNGVELLAEMNKKYPALPILFSSGLTGTLPPSPPDAAARSFIAKPYATNDLLWAIAHLLGTAD